MRCNPITPSTPNVTGSMDVITKMDVKEEQ
jgi:hypothetical protein